MRHLSGVFGDYALTNQLVFELMPTDGEGAMALAVIAMLLWRRATRIGRRGTWPTDFHDGIVGLAARSQGGALLVGLGLPATLLWLALELEKQFERYAGFDSGKRLLVTLGLAAGVFLGMTSDRGSRWTWNAAKQYLTQNDPVLAGWLPESGGIIYSVDMTVFNDTFFKNPAPPWRYVLGFESALMRPEDLAVARKVQWNFGDLRAYEPWVKKMRRQDRLIIPASWCQPAARPAPWPAFPNWNGSTHPMIGGSGAWGK